MLQSAPKERKIFPRTKFRELEKRLEAPTMEEGFTEVVKVDFEVRVMLFLLFLLYDEGIKLINAVGWDTK